MQNRKLAMGVAALGLVFGAAAIAQEGQQSGKKLPSPPGTADVTLKGQQITITYGRPSMRGRKIMGDLVPYGKVWRTGANEATTLTTPVDLDINGTHVPAGKYTLWTLPSEGTWKLIINKQTGQWGTEYHEGQDLARVDMQKSQTSGPVEQFTISWKTNGGDRADLVLEWENTRVWVPVRAQ